jgi:hypothetical protein
MMVFDIKFYTNHPSLSFRDCLVNGEIDIQRFWVYKRRKHRMLVYVDPHSEFLMVWSNYDYDVNQNHLK